MGGTCEAFSATSFLEEPHFVKFYGWISRKTNLLSKKVTKLCFYIGGFKLLP